MPQRTCHGLGEPVGAGVPHTRIATVLIAGHTRRALVLGDVPHATPSCACTQCCGEDADHLGVCWSDGTVDVLEFQIGSENSVAVHRSVLLGPGGPVRCLGVVPGVGFVGTREAVVAAWEPGVRGIEAAGTAGDGSDAQGSNGDGGGVVDLRGMHGVDPRCVDAARRMSVTVHLAGCPAPRRAELSIVNASHRGAPDIPPAFLLRGSESAGVAAQMRPEVFLHLRLNSNSSSNAARGGFTAPCACLWAVQGPAACPTPAFLVEQQVLAPQR